MPASVLLLLASAMSLSQFADDEGRYMAMHGDSRVDRDNLWSIASIDIWIAPEGRVAGCSIASSAGDRATAEHSCKVLVGYQFSAPLGPNGQKSFGSITATVSAFSDKLFPQSRSLTKNFLAEADKMATDAKLAVPDKLLTLEGQSGINVFVQTNGRVVACEGVGAVSPLLAKVACGKASAKSFAVRSSDGQPVAYVKYVELLPESYFTQSSPISS